MINGFLPPESIACEVPTAQDAPQRTLCIRHSFAELTCVRVWHWRGVAPSSSFG
jgi:hypothetical protein